MLPVFLRSAKSNGKKLAFFFRAKRDDSNQKANDKVKIIAARAGIGDDVNGAPKWSLVTTHTARRSAATNLWLAGMPLPEIMQMGGWRTEHQMKKYLVSSGIELAKVSAGRAFFG